VAPAAPQCGGRLSQIAKARRSKKALRAHAHSWLPGHHAVIDRRLCKAPPCASMAHQPTEEDVMPEVVFYALGGRSVEQKRALIKDFTDAVVKNYKVDASAVTITIVESSKEDKAKGGVLFSDMGPPKS
jgi:4-oxalocrotonate tautomerase